MKSSDKNILNIASLVKENPESVDEAAIKFVIEHLSKKEASQSKEKLRNLIDKILLPNSESSLKNLAKLKKKGKPHPKSSIKVDKGFFKDLLDELDSDKPSIDRMSESGYDPQMNGYRSDMTLEEFSDLLAARVEKARSINHIREDLTRDEITYQFALFAHSSPSNFIPLEVDAEDQVIIDQLNSLSPEAKEKYLQDLKRKYIALHCL